MDFDSGTDGWVAQDFLERIVAAIPPTPTNPIPGTASSPGSTTSSTSVTLSWNTSSGAAYYGFAVRDMTTNALVVDTTSTSAGYTASNLTAGRNYRWNVAAFNSAGVNSTYTTPLYFTTPVSVGTPTVSIDSPSGNVTVPNGTISYGFLGPASALGSTLAAVEWRVNSGNWNTASGTTTWTFTVGSLSVGANPVEVRSRNSQGTYSATASRTFTRESGGQTTPTISGISPNPVVGSSSQQTITIAGTNFASPPGITLTWTGQSNYQVPSNQVTFVSSTEIRMAVRTGVNADNWTAKVTNPNGQFSNVLAFPVTTGGVNTSGFLTCPVPSYGQAYGPPIFSTGAPVSSIFDHTPGTDGLVVAYNGLTTTGNSSAGWCRKFWEP